MAISYTKVDIRGVAAEPILEEILFENKTIADGLVTFETDIKAETIFTEGAATTTMQAFSSGAPSSSGSMDLFDVAVTPYKYMYYQEFDPNTLRSSRFKRDMKAGAWNMLSGEFERIVIGGLVAKNMSYDIEYKFWNDITAAQQTAIAALTPGTAQNEVGAAEQAWAAARTAGLINGVVSSMLYNSWNAAASAGLGTRVKVAGTTVSATNIYTEITKVYTAFSAALLAAQGKSVGIYVPHAYKQFINVYNSNPANYQNPFVITGGKYYLHDVEIRFVPLVGDVMIGSAKEHLFWCTDLNADVNTMKVDKIAENREDMFVKSIGTITPYVGLQASNVLYIG